MHPIDRIMTERYRQIETLGYSPEHDDTYTDEKWQHLIHTYACFLVERDYKSIGCRDEFIKDLTNVGALVVAALEAINRSIDEARD